MATWSVLSRALPSDTGTKAAERVVFVREKFSWAALFFAPLVLLRYRLWLVFAAYVAASLLLGFAFARAGLPGEVVDVVMMGFHLLIALELPALRVRKLASLGYAEEGVVIAEDRDEAEQRFFAEWAGHRPEPPRAPAAPRPPAPSGAAVPTPGAVGLTHPIIGSFPGTSAP